MHSHDPPFLRIATNLDPNTFVPAHGTLLDEMALVARLRIERG